MIISKRRPFDEAKIIVNQAKNQKDSFWKDHVKMSEPKKKKFVRYAKKGSPLQIVLKKINSRLRSWDNFLPCHIYGGRTNKSATQAAAALIENQGKKRFLLKTDLKRFFEQVEKGRVFSLLKNKCGCSKDGANYLATICTVPEGPKDNPSQRHILARGFSPSTRLATWCNIDFFYRLRKLTGSHFKNLTPKPAIAVYVDDILIAASNVELSDMEALKNKVFLLAESFGIEINKDQPKTKIFKPEDKQEVLGILLHRRSLALPIKSRQSMTRLKRNIKKETGKSKKKLKEQLGGLYQNLNQIKRENEKLKTNRVSKK